MPLRTRVRTSGQTQLMGSSRNSGSSLTSPLEQDTKAPDYRYHPYATFSGWQSMTFNTGPAQAMPSMESDLDPSIFILPETGSTVDSEPANYPQQSPTSFSEVHRPVPPPGPKRKYPPPAACLPCRARKVKCNHLQPCSTCVERDHPEACVYKPPTKKPKLEPASRSSSSVTSKKGKDSKGEFGDDSWRPSKADWFALTESITSLKREIATLRQNSATLPYGQASDDRSNSLHDGSSCSSGNDNDDLSEADEREESRSLYSSSGSTLINGFHATDHLTDVYLGGNSAPALVAALGDRRRNATSLPNFLVDQSEMLPAFVLGNESATYPFVDLFTLQFGPHEKLRKLYRMIPEDSECIGLFNRYRDTANVLFPGVVDVTMFESELSEFLSKRQGISSKATDQELFSLFGESLEGMHFVGLLLAVLASGSQCSDISRATTETKSQIFVCGAYECLRSVNYLSRSNLVDIQTLLVLGNVISNNWDSGVAWSLLGITGRLAQGQGLDHDPPLKHSMDQKALRNKVWQRVMWQDCLLSMTYDRASCIVDYRSDRTPIGGELSYSDTMFELCSVGLDLLRFRSDASSRKHDINLKNLIKYEERIHTICSRTVPHLREKSKSVTMKQHLEYYNLLMHKNYFLSEIGRSTLKFGTSCAPKFELMINHLQSTCVDSLRGTVEAFLGLQNVSKFACHSWAAVHRALSSALLLAIIGRQNEDEKVKQMLGHLVSVMSATISDVDPSILVTPITRAVEWLRRLIPLNIAAERAASNEHREKSGLGAAIGGMAVATTNNEYIHLQTVGTSSANAAVAAAAAAVGNNPYSMVESILYGREPASGIIAQ